MRCNGALKYGVTSPIACLTQRYRTRLCTVTGPRSRRGCRTTVGSSGGGRNGDVHATFPTMLKNKQCLAIILWYIMTFGRSVLDKHWIPMADAYFFFFAGRIVMVWVLTRINGDGGRGYSGTDSAMDCRGAMDIRSS